MVNRCLVASCATPLYQIVFGDPQNFVDAGRAPSDILPAALPQCRQPVVQGVTAKFRGGRPLDGQSSHFVVSHQQLEDGTATEVTGVTTFPAAACLPKLRRQRQWKVFGRLVGRRLISDFASGAQDTNQPLAQDARHGTGNEIGFDSHVD